MNKLSRENVVKYFYDKNPEIITEQYMFGNFSNLRLSVSGYTLMAAEFESYKFSITENVTAMKKVLLNKHMYAPYFISDKYIYLFSKNDALTLQLIGDVNLWISSISL